MNFEEAVRQKTLHFPQESPFSLTQLERYIIIVPKKQQDFHFYMRDFVSKKWEAVNDESAKTYCTDENYTLAAVHLKSDGFNYQILNLDDGSNGQSIQGSGYFPRISS